MDTSSALDGIETILAYPFKNQGWQSKFVIGAALFFGNYIIPFVPSIFVTGYFANILHATIVDGSEPTLPEWNDWGKLFARGLKVTVATMIYLMPAVLFLIVGYLIAYVPLIILTASSGSGSDVSNNFTGLLVVSMLIGIPMMVIGFILYIPLVLMLPGAIAHLVAKDSFAAAFRIREWWAIMRANLWGFFAAAALIAGVYMLLLLVSYLFYFSIILCVLFPVFLSVVVMYISVVGAPILGAAYRKGVQKLAEGKKSE